MSRRLEPCPFCPSADVELVHRQRRVVCNGCGAEGPISDTAEGAGRLWNVRPAHSSHAGRFERRDVADTRGRDLLNPIV